MTFVQRSPVGQIITFYSYKGGTGRSMALANVACLLAARPESSRERPVLVIDWDLEAPGLHRYFDPFLPAAAADDRGLIDLFWDLREQIDLADVEDRDDLARQLVEGIDLGRYTCATDYPCLTFLRAGRFDGDYSTRTNTFA